MPVTLVASRGWLVDGCIHRHAVSLVQMRGECFDRKAALKCRPLGRQGNLNLTGHPRISADFGSFGGIPKGCPITRPPDK